MICGGFVFLVPPCLTVYVNVGLAFVVDDGAEPTTLHKGRCHIVDGQSVSAPLDSHVPKITSSHCIHEITAET